MISLEIDRYRIDIKKKEYKIIKIKKKWERNNKDEIMTDSSGTG